MSRLKLIDALTEKVIFITRCYCSSLVEKEVPKTKCNEGAKDHSIGCLII